VQCIGDGAIADLKQTECFVFPRLDLQGFGLTATRAVGQGDCAPY